MDKMSLVQMIGMKIKVVEGIMQETESHESLVYWRGVIAGLEYVKGEIEKDG